MRFESSGVRAWIVGLALAVILPTALAYILRRQTAWMNLVAALWVVGLATLVVLFVLTAAPQMHAPYEVVLLAAATLVACGGRTLEAFARVRDLAAARKEALTDDLEGQSRRLIEWQEPACRP